MDNKIKTVVTYTLLHFLVDFTTVFLISGLLIGPAVGIVNRGEVIIAYNLIAFAGQLPIGMIADIFKKNRLLVAVGCALAGISYLFLFISPWVACVLAAIGNGAFHIGAGVDILRNSMPKAGLSGLFVSSGALGVWLAYKTGDAFIIWICPVVMLIAAVLVVLWGEDIEYKNVSYKIKFDKPSLINVVAVICFVLTIVIRSLLGMVMNFSWKAVPILSFLFVLAVVAGKALGGFFADRFGYIKTAVLSLAISNIAFVFSFDYWIAGVVAALCFNMTMPLTLTAIASVSRQKYGFAFGLTTFALAIGFIPVVFGANSWFSTPLLVGGNLVSLILLVCGFLLLKKQNC